MIYHGLAHHSLNGDRKALRLWPGRLGSGLVPSINKLCEQNLAERRPAPPVEWFFHSHPAIFKRVAAAEAWARRS